MTPDGTTVLLLLLGGVFSVLWGFIKARQEQFYTQYGTRLHGQVISYSKYRVPAGRGTRTSYTVMVQAEDGNTYRVATYSRKARKYRKQKDVEIVAVRSFEETIELSSAMSRYLNKNLHTDIKPIPPRRVTVTQSSDLPMRYPHILYDEMQSWSLPYRIFWYAVGGAMFIAGIIQLIEMF